MAVNDQIGLRAHGRKEAGCNLGSLQSENVEKFGLDALLDRRLGVKAAYRARQLIRGGNITGWLMPQLRGILRRLSRAPVFTAVTLVILAVGIGATTAIFSVVNSIVLRPLPYSQPEELVDVRATAPRIGIDILTISSGAYFTFREENHVFQDIGLYDPGINYNGQTVSITGLDEPMRVPPSL